jgi:hypothetical protein
MLPFLISECVTWTQGPRSKLNTAPITVYVRNNTLIHEWKKTVVCFLTLL